MKPNAVVIILNWNKKEFLDSCLQSVLHQSYKNYYVFFVDNASTDGSVTFVRKKFKKEIAQKRIRILENKKNFGFAKGNNEAIHQVLKEKNIQYVVTLNNDTRVDKCWLVNLLKPLNKKCGIAASISILPDGSVESKGHVIGKNGFVYLAREEKPVVTGGCSCAYTRELLEGTRMGRDYFDSDFFMYGEDHDLCIRGLLAGYKTSFVKDSIVYHTSGASSSSSFKTYYAGRNSVFVAMKNFPHLFTLLPRWLFIHVLQMLYILFTRGEWSIVHAKFDAIRMIPQMIKKRKAIQKKRVLTKKEFKRLLVDRWLPR